MSRVIPDSVREPRQRRRPHSVPTTTPTETIDVIVELREKLTATGLDAGPDTIKWHLISRTPRESEEPPRVSTSIAYQRLRPKFAQWDGQVDRTPHTVSRGPLVEVPAQRQVLPTASRAVDRREGWAAARWRHMPQAEPCEHAAAHSAAADRRGGDRVHRRRAALSAPGAGDPARNDTRSKTISIAAADLNLSITKFRTGSFFPSLLERRQSD
jgi:hypothetical protein